MPATVAYLVLFWDAVSGTEFKGRGRAQRFRREHAGGHDDVQGIEHTVLIVLENGRTEKSGDVGVDAGEELVCVKIVWINMESGVEAGTQNKFGLVRLSLTGLS